eukprot:g45404.t1
MIASTSPATYLARQALNSDVDIQGPSSAAILGAAISALGKVGAAGSLVRGPASLKMCVDATASSLPASARQHRAALPALAWRRSVGVSAVLTAQTSTWSSPAPGR